MKILEVLYPEIESFVRYKIWDLDDIEEFVKKYKGLTREEYQYLVVGAVIFNWESEVKKILRDLGNKQKARSIFNSIYNGCIMLNPGLDLTLWYEMSKSHEHNIVLPPPPALQTPFIQDTEQQVQPKKKIISRRITKAKFLGLESYLKSKIVGQDEAIETIVSSLKRSVVGLNDSQRPLGVFLFTGPSGVGKTEMAKQIHQYLYEDRSKLIRIDGGEYQHKHENQKLIGCFAPGSKVWMVDGTFKNIEDVQIGDKVITHKGNIKPVTYLHEYECFDSMLEIKFAGNPNPIICTPQHEFYAIQSSRDDGTQSWQNALSNKSAKKENLDWYAAKTLQAGDWLSSPKPKMESGEEVVFDLVDYLPERSNYKYDDEYIWYIEKVKVNRFIQLDERFARLAGYYASEGGYSTDRKSCNFTLNITEIEYLTEIKQLMADIFNLNSFRLEDRSERSSWRIHFSSVVVAKFMSTLFGSHTHYKKIPLELIHASHTIKYSLLETALCGDGCLKINGRVDYSTTSEQLYSGLLTIIRSLGFNPYVSKEISRKDNWQDRYRIYISGDQLLKLNENMTQLSQAILSEFFGREVRNIRGDDEYTYQRILSVKEVPYEGKVYDLAVEDDISYAINCINVHNSPPGYVGSDEGGQLTNQIKANPNTVFLIDEIEKAHPDIWNTFLRIFDEGLITDARGETHSFRNAIIIMTSNLGNQDVVANMMDSQTGFNTSQRLDYKSLEMPKRSAVERFTNKAIQKDFRPEFLNRIDKIVIFNHLTLENFRQIAQIELDTIQEKLLKKGIDLTYTQDVLDAMIQQGVNPVEGARGLAKIRREKIEDIISDTLLHIKGRVARGSSLSLYLSQDGIFECYFVGPKGVKDAKS